MNKKHQINSPAIYHIRVKGKLDDKWSEWFGSFTMNTRDSGETLFTGTVSNQAELFGTLVKINSLGLPILLVARVNCPSNQENHDGYSNCQECVAYFNDTTLLPYCFRTQTKWNKQCMQLINKKEE